MVWVINEEELEMVILKGEVEWWVEVVYEFIFSRVFVYLFWLIFFVGGGIE